MPQPQPQQTPFQRNYSFIELLPGDTIKWGYADNETEVIADVLATVTFAHEIQVFTTLFPGSALIFLNIHDGRVFDRTGTDLRFIKVLSYDEDNFWFDLSPVVIVDVQPIQD